MKKKVNALAELVGAITGYGGFGQFPPRAWVSVSCDSGEDPWHSPLPWRAVTGIACSSTHVTEPCYGETAEEALEHLTVKILALARKSTGPENRDAIAAALRKLES